MMPLHLPRKGRQIERVENLCRNATREKSFPHASQRSHLRDRANPQSHSLPIQQRKPQNQKMAS
jgi:hypothetical protein